LHDANTSKSQNSLRWKNSRTPAICPHQEGQLKEAGEGSEAGAHCLIDAMTKKQHKRIAAIKQKCDQEESKRMWFLIKRMVKDPHSPSVLRVQRVVDGEVKE
jgi:hypothetical protein